MERSARPRLRAVLFDLDGTLLDTAPDFVTAVNLLRAEHGREPLPGEPIRRTVSHGARALVRLAFGIGEEDPAFEPLRQRLLALYEAHLLVDTVPFPGIAELLQALAARGIRWGVVTNKPNYLAEPLLARAHLEPPADVLVCPDHVSRTKPDPEPLLLACAPGLHGEGSGLRRRPRPRHPGRAQCGHAHHRRHLRLPGARRSRHAVAGGLPRGLGGGDRAHPVQPFPAHLRAQTRMQPAHLYQAPPDLLAGRNILVTGAGDGIGRAAALAFAAHGATVVLLGRTQAKLDAVYDEIVANGGAQPVIQLLDLKSAGDESYQALNEAIVDTLGCLHGVLHNAALLGPRTPLEQYPTAKWLEVMAVNLNAPFALTRALMPALRLAPEASIVFSSSSVGRRGRAYWGAYAVSKFGIEGLSQVLADELVNTSAIRINCINPGATNTAMRREAYPAESPASNPHPAQIMAAYLYLMGPASRGVTGCSLDAQGG